MAKLHELIAALPDRQKAAQKNIEESVGVFEKKPNLFEGSLIINTAIDAARAAELDSRVETKITTTVANRLFYTFELIEKEMDVQASIDASNQTAKADLIINGVTLLKDVPAVTLLTIEKKARLWMAMVAKAPTLPTGIAWLPDPGQGENIYVTATPVRRQKTEQIPYGLILAPATEKFPAQVTKESKINIVANIEETKWNGMIPSDVKAGILGRLQELAIAAQTARQRANETTANQLSIGSVLTGYVLTGPTEVPIPAAPSASVSPTVS